MDQSASGRCRRPPQVVLILLLGLTTIGCAGGAAEDSADPKVKTMEKMSPCPDRPNCVSSRSTEADRRIEPLRFEGSADAAMTRLKALLSERPGATVVDVQPDYLRAEFRSTVFGFVDDVELELGEPGVIDVRSASRSGYWDFGANRRRVESIREAFAASAATG